MRRLVAIVVAGLSLPVATGEAAACRLSGNRPLPVSEPYSAVALATVFDGDQQRSDVRFQLIFDGRVAERTARLDHSGQLRDGDLVITLCQALGPRVRTGERVVVVLGMRDGRQQAVGWARLADAERDDDFFALYRNERRPAARRRLLERWRAVNRLGGPIPLTDPSRWMAPFAGGLQAVSFREHSRASFRVGLDGRVTSCETQRTGPATPRDAWVCGRLARQRFRPPILSRERYGSYEVRWNMEARPAPQ